MISAKSLQKAIKEASEPEKKPRALRAADTKETFHYATGKTTLGDLLVAFSEFGIVAIILKQNASDLVQELTRRFPKAHLISALPADRALTARVIQLIETSGDSRELPLDIRGTTFQQKVWRAVRQIPVGQTSTYSEIAQKIGAIRAVRAVGSTCTHNRFAMIIPCHRVLHNGSEKGDKSSKMSPRVRQLLARESIAAHAPIKKRT